MVDLVVEGVGERVDGNEMGFVIWGEGDIMDVRVKEVLNFGGGVDVVDIGIENEVEDDGGMVRGGGGLVIEVGESLKGEGVKERVKDGKWMMVWNMVVNCWRKKECLVGIVRRKMYVCDSIKCYG